MAINQNENILKCSKCGHESSSRFDVLFALADGSLVCSKCYKGGKVRVGDTVEVIKGSGIKYVVTKINSGKHFGEVCYLTSENGVEIRQLRQNLRKVS